MRTFVNSAFRQVHAIHETGINPAMLEERKDARDAVAARLRRSREVLGMSKRDFAEGAGMTEQAYGAFENERRELSLIAAKKLRSAYGLSLEFIYFGNKADLPHRIAKYL